MANPLVLVGFGLALFFGVTRAILKAGLLKPLSQRQSSSTLRLILKQGFRVAILVVVLGFGYAAFQITKAQPNPRPGPTMDIGTIQQTASGTAVSGVQGNVTVVEESRKDERSRDGVQK